jgi:hypothetical protein
MKIKKYLLEQVNMKAEDKLNRAIRLGCIAKYTNFIMDSGQPTLIDFGGKDVWAISGKGKTSKKQYFFLAEPMVMVDAEEAAKNPSDRDPSKPLTREWVCPNLELNDEQKKYLESLESKGWTTNRPTEKDLDDEIYLGFDLVSGKKYTPTGYSETTSADTQFNDVKAFTKYFEKLDYARATISRGTGGSVIVYKRNTGKSQFKPEEGGDCRKNIEILHDLFQKRRVEDEDYVKAIHKIVQNCVNQRDFTLRPDLRKKINDLANINTYDREIGKLKIYLPQRESVNRLIKKTLIETKERKNNQIIENKLVESRLKFIIEDVSVFNKRSKQVKIKEGFKFLRETSYLKSMGMLNENLSDIFKQMFGNSFENILGTVSDPFVGSILNKLSIPQEIKTSVLDTIKQRANELLAHMDTCENLSKFISDIVSEITVLKMTAKNITGSQVLDSAIVDTMGDDVFKTKLSEKIEEEVCLLFNKYAENAKNLVTKLTSEEV